MYGSFLRRFVFFNPLLFLICFSPVKVEAMIQSQYNAVASYCQGKAGVSAYDYLSWNQNQGINWAYYNRGWDWKACDSAEPNSQTGWCKVAFTTCNSGSDCYHLGQFAFFPSSDTNGYRLKFTGEHCAQLNASGCASADNTGICDQIYAARSVADSAVAAGIEANNSIQVLNQDLNRQTDEIVAASYGWSNVLGRQASVAESMAGAYDWSEWGVRADTRFREDHQIPFMQQSLVAATDTNNLLSQIMTNGITATFDTTPVVTAVNNDTAVSLSILDVASNSNDELVTIRNFQDSLNDTSLDIASNTSDIKDSLDSLGVDQRQTTAAIADGMEFLAGVIQQNQPTVNVDMTATNQRLDSTNQQLAGMSQQLDGIQGAIAGSSSSITDAVNGLGGLLSETGQLPSDPDGSQFSDGQSMGNNAAGLISGVGDFTSQVINLATLDGSGFLGSRPATLPNVHFDIPLGAAGSSSVDWDFSEFETLLNILKALMWVSVWLMVLNIIVGDRK